MTMTLTSRGFAHNAAMPRRYSCDGENVSPPLSWTNAPAGTRSFAIICADPDAPGKTFYHWAIFDIAATVSELAEGVRTATAPPGARQARNDFGKSCYGGPCPPRGHGPHHYHFHLYALDVARLDVGDDADCRMAGAAARAHALAEAVLIGVYERC